MYMHNYLFLIIIYCSLIYLLNYISYKKKILIHNATLSSHKKNFKKDIPLIGGLYLFLCIFFTALFLKNDLFYSLTFYSVSYLILGLVSDTSKIFAPKMRLIATIIISTSIIVHAGIIIETIDIKIIDALLKYNLISIIFFSLCIALVVNGFNFIDGTHGNVSIYSILIFLSLSQISKNPEIFYFLSIIISIFSILNFNEKCFLGDNGAYFLGAFVSLLLIKFFIIQDLNSFYIAGLLIYPVMEVIWSIFRKKINGFNVVYADKLHLHHLIHRLILKFKISNKYSSIFASISINSINGLFIYFYTENFMDKTNLIKFISLYILTYVLSYYLLINFLNKKLKI